MFCRIYHYHQKGKKEDFGRYYSRDGRGRLRSDAPGARLLADVHGVVGVDNLNGYYDPRLKEARIAKLRPFSNFQFQRADIADRKSMTH